MREVFEHGFHVGLVVGTLSGIALCGLVALLACWLGWPGQRGEGGKDRGTNASSETPPDQRKPPRGGSGTAPADTPLPTKPPRGAAPSVPAKSVPTETVPYPPVDSNGDVIPYRSIDAFVAMAHRMADTVKAAREADPEEKQGALAGQSAPPPGDTGPSMQDGLPLCDSSDKCCDMQRLLAAAEEEVKRLNGLLYARPTQQSWDILEKECERLEAELREFVRLAQVVANATDDATNAQAVHEIIQQARGNGWTDVPEPVALQLVKRAEAAEAEAKRLQCIIDTLAVHVTALSRHVEAAQ